MTHSTMLASRPAHQSSRRPGPSRAGLGRAATTCCWSWSWASSAGQSQSLRPHCQAQVRQSGAGALYLQAVQGQQFLPRLCHCSLGARL